MKKKIIFIILSILLILITFMIFTICNIIQKLDEYGLWKDKLPQTLAVYFHLSKGFTIDEGTKGTVFIGRHNIYTDIMKKNGYSLSEQLGNGYWYENKEKNVVTIVAENEWCHWFRLYSFSEKIENFK